MQEEAWHRRQAIQIAAALPEDVESALLVLDLARDLVVRFLAGPPIQPREDVLERERGTVVSLSSAISGNKR